MNIFKNFIGGSTLTWSALKFQKYMKVIKLKKEQGDLEAERQEIAKVTAEWSKYISEAFDMRFKISGRENIPEGACVFVANHQGYWDIMGVLQALEGKQVGFIAKNEFKKVPLLRDWIVAIRGIFIDRMDSRGALQVMKEGWSLLQQGFSLMIFPEGTRSHSNEMGEFKAGSFKLATKVNVPIVPIAINGTYKMYEETESMERGQTAAITILKPIETIGLKRDELNKIPEMVKEMIRKEIQKEIKEESEKLEG